MNRRFIAFFIVFVGITVLFSYTMADTKWSVLREDNFIREDGIDGTLQDVYFIDNQNGLVVGDKGLILGTADGGKTWTKREVNMRPPGDAQRTGKTTWYGGWTTCRFRWWCCNVI